MPDFLLTDPGGQRFKLTVPDGVSEQDIHALIAGQELPGEPQPRSRGDILKEGTGQLKEALAPSYLKDTPPTRESDLALADPAGKPRKIGPPSGPPTAMQMAGGLGADIASQALPELGAAKLAMPALGLAPRQIRSHLDELNEAVRAGRMTPEQLAQARVRLGQPAESPVPRISATRPVNQQTLDELRRDELPEYARPRPAPPSPPPDRFSVRPPVAPPSTSALGHYGQDFYNEHLAPHFPDQQAFVQSYFNGAYNGRFDVTSKASGVHGPGLYMNGPLVIDGKKFGDITRTIDVDGKTAHHSLLEVKDKARGGGFVKQMTANQIDLYRKMGIERVELLANIDVGGYAWAKYGWLPSPQDWQTAAWGLQSRFRTLYPHLDHSTQAYVNNLLNNPDPRAIWGISDVTTPWQHPSWDEKINTVGKAMLSGNNWHGTLLLGDERQMARFNDYVNKGK